MSRAVDRLRLSRGQLWIALLVLLPALASLLAPMSTVDLAYQIRAGQLMLADVALLRTDPFTFTVGGEPWLNQQWGAQVLFGALYDTVGWSGLAIVRAGLISAIVALVFVAARWRGASIRVAAVLALTGFLVGLAAMGLRPQLWGMLCFAAVGAIASASERWPRMLWLVPLVALCWANLHGSFVLAPALVGVILVVDLTVHRSRVRRDLVVLVLTLAATLLTPFGAGAWAYALSLSANPELRQLVTEWQPTSPLSVVGAIYLVSIATAVVLVVRRPRAVAWPWLLWLAALAVLGVIAQRGIAWWAIGAPPILAGVVTALLAGRGAPSRVSRPSDAREPREGNGREQSLANGVLALALVAAIVLLLPSWRGSAPLYGPNGLLVDAPQGLTDALLARATAADRVFNAQRWGSWLELAVPLSPVFVDSRVELFPAAVWEDYLDVSRGRSGWQQRLDRWGATVLVISRDDQADLLNAVTADPAWELVHSDEEGAVYIRAGSDVSGG